MVLGVAYFVAELWNGPSRATWLLARVAAAAAIVAPALLWVGKAPLCRFVRVEDVNPGSLACTGNPGDLVITARVAGLVLVMGVAIVALLYQLVQLQRVSRSAVNAGEGGAVLGMAPDERRHLLLLLLTGVGAWIGIVLANSILGRDGGLRGARVPVELRRAARRDPAGTDRGVRGHGARRAAIRAWASSSRR